MEATDFLTPNSLQKPSEGPLCLHVQKREQVNEASRETPNRLRISPSLQPSSCNETAGERPLLELRTPDGLRIRIPGKLHVRASFYAEDFHVRL